jgi:hypothetical protein
VCAQPSIVSVDLGVPISQWFAEQNIVEARTPSVRSPVVDPDGRAPLIAHLKLRAMRQVQAGRSVIVEVEGSATRS